jgi:hypothetical protein
MLFLGFGVIRLLPSSKKSFCISVKTYRKAIAAPPHSKHETVFKRLFWSHVRKGVDPSAGLLYSTKAEG